MDRLKETLQTVLETYTGQGLNGFSYLAENEESTVFTIISVGQLPDKRIVDAGLIVQLIDNQIVIDRDVNDKLLVDALLQAGIPREQIILAYAGEPVKEPAA